MCTCTCKACNRGAEVILRVRRDVAGPKPPRPVRVRRGGNHGCADGNSVLERCGVGHEGVARLPAVSPCRGVSFSRCDAPTSRTRHDDDVGGVGKDKGIDLIGEVAVDAGGASPETRAEAVGAVGEGGGKYPVHVAWQLDRVGVGVGVEVEEDDAGVSRKAAVRASVFAQSRAKDQPGAVCGAVPTREDTRRVRPVPVDKVRSVGFRRASRVETHGDVGPYFGVAGVGDGQRGAY